MKNFFIKNTGILAGLALLVASCAEGDNVVDEIFDNETRGAILRTVNFETNEIPIGASDYTFEVDLEVQDQQNGTLVDAIEVYLGFVDNTFEDTENETDRIVREEVLYETLNASTFTTGEFGLPRTSFSVALPAMLSALNLEESDIFVTGGDQLRVRFELVLNDGRRYSFADNSGTLTGSFFSSPFLYTAVVVCPPLAPSAGTWTFDLQDSYGDGWNGASLDVTIDGEVTNITMADGSESTVTLDVPEGAQAISIIFNSGDWDEEITYQVTSSTGTTILDLAPDHTAGVELLDYCNTSLDL
ncbi:hypothetical protein [Croceivirga radicis]|nr:hypothetical protein [Croceivirga radicis]